MENKHVKSSINEACIKVYKTGFVDRENVEAVVLKAFDEFAKSSESEKHKAFEDGLLLGIATTLKAVIQNASD